VVLMDEATSQVDSNLDDKVSLWLISLSTIS